jgi:hypothetical protein
VVASDASFVDLFAVFQSQEAVRGAEGDLAFFSHEAVGGAEFFDVIVRETFAGGHDRIAEDTLFFIVLSTFEEAFLT